MNALDISDWRFFLRSGDAVFWNDPDAGRCSRGGVISEIEYMPDDSAVILFADGYEVSVFLRELS